MSCIVSFGLSAQAPSAIVTFTVESLCQEIDARSTSVHLGQLGVEEAEAGIQLARNHRLPDVSASWQVGYLGNGYLTDRNFSNGMAVHNPHFVNNLVLEAAQTIYCGGAVTNGIKMAELEKQQASLSLEQSRQQTRFMILAALIDLQCLELRADVLEKNIQLASQELDMMRVRFDQGVVLKSDLTRYELQIADLRLQLDRVAEAITTSNVRIANALAYPIDTRFRLETPAIDENYPLMSAADWQGEAASRNLGISQARVGIDMSQTARKLAKAEKLPYVGLFAYGNFNSPIVVEVPVINKNFMYWGFGVNVGYNISSLFKTNKKIRKAEIAEMESHDKLSLAQENVSNEVATAYEAFLTAASELRTQRSSLKLAEENYGIVSERFGQGMALVTDLVDAANVRIAAQTGLENAKSRLQFCLFRLKYISNTL